MAPARWPTSTSGCRPVADESQAAVIDFGLLGIGDPACDLMVAWTFLSAAGRAAFRAALPADEAAWARGRGWALDLGLMCAARAAGNPVLTRICQHAVSQVLTEHGHPEWPG